MRYVEPLHRHSTSRLSKTLLAFPNHLGYLGDCLSLFDSCWGGGEPDASPWGLGAGEGLVGARGSYVARGGSVSSFLG